MRGLGSRRSNISSYTERNKLQHRLDLGVTLRLACCWFPLAYGATGYTPEWQTIKEFLHVEIGPAISPTEISVHEFSLRVVFCQTVLGRTPLRSLVRPSFSNSYDDSQHRLCDVVRVDGTWPVSAKLGYIVLNGTYSNCDAASVSMRLIFHAE